jgi:hypothetical protein
MPRLPLVILPFLLSLLAAPVRADDERSEHTAVLVGDPADTAGVTMHFEPERGWSMDYRARPGATARRVSLPFLSQDHAHYHVVVGPRRAPVTFVLQSREKLTSKTEVIWVVDRRGQVTWRWTLGQLLSNSQISQLRRSTSHVYWLDDPPALTGSSVEIRTAGAVLTIDPATGAVTR